MTTFTSDTPKSEDLQDRVALANAYVLAELSRAMSNHKPYNSAHEGYSIILEELDEVWDEIKANNRRRAIEEAVQVASSALRFIIDLGGDLEATLGPIDPEASEDEPDRMNFDIERLMDLIRQKTAEKEAADVALRAPEEAAEADVTDPAPAPIDLASEPIPGPVAPAPPGPGTFGYLSSLLADVVRERAVAQATAPKAE